jgi:hypothetical protein
MLPGVLGLPRRNVALGRAPSLRHCGLPKRRARWACIEDSYGVSDVSGRPIPQMRLEAIPEAICRLEEEQAFEINSWN